MNDSLEKKPTAAPAEPYIDDADDDDSGIGNNGDFLNSMESVLFDSVDGFDIDEYLNVDAIMKSADKEGIHVDDFLSFTMKHAQKKLLEKASTRAKAYDKDVTCKTKPKESNHSCNVCNGTCTTRCSMCRLVYYCSVDCQRKDWKVHKKVCKGKRKKSPVSGKTTKKKAKSAGLQLESLPEEILMCIGKVVAELCSVRDFVFLARTSKQFHRILMDKEIVSSVLETGNDRIFNDVFPQDYSVTTARNLEELSLCEGVVEAKIKGLLKDNRVYYDQKVVVDPAHANFLIQIIGVTLMNNPSALVILDAHSGMETPIEESMGTSEIMGKEFCMNFRNVFENEGEEVVAWLKSRVRLRPWGFMAVSNALESQDAHGNNIRQGKSWVEVYFRMGDIEGVELPPRPDYYNSLPIPEEKLYGNFDDVVNLSRQSHTGDPEECLLTFLDDISHGEDVSMVLESMLLELRTNGSTEMGSEMDCILHEIICRREARMESI